MKSFYSVVPQHLVASEEEAIWYFGALFTVRASAQSTAGAFDLIEVVMPEGTSPPRHIHRREDEFVYVLDGQITFTCGEQTIRAERGAFVFLPRDVAHTFRVEGPGTAHVLNLCVPAGLKDFLKEMGEPARERTLPPPQTLDLAKLHLVAAKYGVEMLRPMQENN
jgi:quercetin dioxygenase-like cupin family protein